MPTAVAPRAAPSSLLPLALAAAAVVALAVSCSATTDAPDAGPGAGEMVVRDDPKCEEMVPCTFRRCIQYCVSIGLQPKGFCNWKPNM
ncbi:unnamed protein product [Miscanthus lutarioriparius]|uniref:Uncharacterized protein n=1 Tax=Miscanthus lutarioriparius TaxID=422564 RepID=A0A811PI55_9POAL|nr:unnamed protein product [Miscanthus lutarioriparius]